MKLKINATDLRTLSDFYGVKLQVLARKAATAWHRACNDYTGHYDKLGTRTTVIDVPPDHTSAQWREMIDAYCKREIDRLPEALEFAIKVAKRTAQAERKNLPNYTEVK